MRALGAGLDVISASERLLVAGALAASLALVWLATREPLAVTGFAAGLIAIGALVWVLRPRAAAEASD